MSASLGLVTTALLVAAGTISLGDDPPKDSVRDSVVKVIGVARDPDPIRPWMKGPPRERTGSGVAGS